MRGIVRLCAASGVAAAVSVMAPAVAAAGPNDVYPLEKVTRGQQGYGVTTFAGTTPERFTFNPGALCARLPLRLRPGGALPAPGELSGACAVRMCRAMPPEPSARVA